MRLACPLACHAAGLPVGLACGWPAAGLPVGLPCGWPACWPALRLACLLACHAAGLRLAWAARREIYVVLRRKISSVEPKKARGWTRMAAPIGHAWTQA